MEKTPFKYKVFIFGSLGLLVIFFGFLVYWMVQTSEFYTPETTTLATPTIIEPNSLIRPATPMVPPIESLDPILGPDNAPITIIYYADFSCPYCQEMSSDVWPRVLADYGSYVRFIWKDMLIYDGSVSLHKGARCAQLQNRFWEYYTTMWSYEFTESRTQDLQTIANQLGIPSAQFTQCLADSSMEEVVLGVAAQGRNLGVVEAPAFFLNGEYHPGLYTYDEVVELIETALDE